MKHLTVLPNPLMHIDEAEIAAWHYHSSPSPDNTDNSEDNPPIDDDGHPLSASSAENAISDISRLNLNLKLCNYQGPPPEEAWAPIHIATGPIELTTMEGTTHHRFNPNTTTTATTIPRSRVPSLRETSLLALTKSVYFDQMTDSEIVSYYPSLMSRLLRQAKDVRASGGRTCSICHRSFVVPRTRWIEWWDCSTYENGLKGPRSPGEKLRPLPFRRFGCSWACIPGSSSSS